MQIAPRAYLRIQILQLIFTLVVHSRHLEIPPASGHSSDRPNTVSSPNTTDRTVYHHVCWVIKLITWRHTVESQDFSKDSDLHQPRIDSHVGP
jgi:hypothetical protein